MVSLSVTDMTAVRILETITITIIYGTECHSMTNRKWWTPTVMTTYEDMPSSAMTLLYLMMAGTFFSYKYNKKFYGAMPSQIIFLCQPGNCRNVYVPTMTWPAALAIFFYKESVYQFHDTRHIHKYLQ